MGERGRGRVEELGGDVLVLGQYRLGDTGVVQRLGGVMGGVWVGG